MKRPNKVRGTRCYDCFDHAASAERHFKPLPTRGAIFEEIPSDADYEKYVSMAVRSLLIYIQKKASHLRSSRAAKSDTNTPAGVRDHGTSTFSGAQSLNDDANSGAKLQKAGDNASDIAKDPAVSARWSPISTNCSRRFRKRLTRTAMWFCFSVWRVRPSARKRASARPRHLS